MPSFGRLNRLTSVKKNDRLTGIITADSRGTADCTNRVIIGVCVYSLPIIFYDTTIPVIRVPPSLGAVRVTRCGRVFLFFFSYDITYNRRRLVHAFIFVRFVTDHKIENRQQPVRQRFSRFVASGRTGKVSAEYYINILLVTA